MHKLLSICLLCLTVFIGYSQTDETEVSLTPTEEAAIIKDIRAKFSLINTDLHSYEQRSGDIEEYSTEGGEYTVYYDGEDPLKIEAIYYGEMGRVAIDYYLWDRKVFFVFHQRFSYNSPIYITEDIPEQGIEAFDDSKTSIEENRYYFYKNSLIRWLDNEKNKVDPSSNEYKEEEIRSLEDIEFILDIAL